MTEWTAKKGKYEGYANTAESRSLAISRYNAAGNDYKAKVL